MGNHNSKDGSSIVYGQKKYRLPIPGKRITPTKKKDKISCGRLTCQSSSESSSEKYGIPRRSSSSGALGNKGAYSFNSTTSDENEPNTPTVTLSSRTHTNNNSYSNILSQSLPSKHYDNYISRCPTNTSTVDTIPEGEGAFPAPSMFDDMFAFSRAGERDIDRQTRQHYILKQVFGGNLHLELTKDPERILESACGLGLWAIEMSQVYTRTKIIAIDKVLPNERLNMNRDENDNMGSVQFGCADLLKPLNYPDNYFDIIYQRELGSAIAHHQWPNLLSELYRITRPGGQIELVEHDHLFFHVGPVLSYINEWCRVAVESIGTTPTYTEHLYKFLEDAGFIDIKLQIFEIPIGEWPENEMNKQQGYLYKELMKTLFKSMRNIWCLGASFDVNEFDSICQDAIAEFDVYHTTTRWKIFTASKPFS